jgi:hypothetical protein
MSNAQRTITTAEELDSLYNSDSNVVIADEYGSPFQNLLGGWATIASRASWSSGDLHSVFGPKFTILIEPEATK